MVKVARLLRKTGIVLMWTAFGVCLIAQVASLFTGWNKVVHAASVISAGMGLVLYLAIRPDQEEPPPDPNPLNRA